MTQYIYFVKCENCEGEPFDFFDEARTFALGCLSKKPCITQTEVCRNDFGECTDSYDLGIVWSWEDEMSDIPEDSEMTFSKCDTIDCDNIETEFNTLDNSLDSAPDNFRKPIPEGMTIEQLVEEMEENEDMVECGWCEDLVEKDECVKDKDLGYLCGMCYRGLKSRGEELMLVEKKCKDKMCECQNKLTEEVAYDRTIGDFNFYTYKGKKSVEIDYEDFGTYDVDFEDFCMTIWDWGISDEDNIEDVPGHEELENGFETLEDYSDAEFEDFIIRHLNALVAKYGAKVKEQYKEYAEESYEEYKRFNYDDDPCIDSEIDAYMDRQRFDEAVEDRQEHKTKKVMECPECGQMSYYPSDGFCGSCGM